MPQLPGYNIGNALLDFSPVSNALQSYQKNALAQQQMGMDQQRLDMDRQTHALQKQNMQRQWSQQDAEKAGSEAFAIHNMQGPAKGIAWQRYLKTYGDGNHTPEELDPNTGPAIAAAHAGKYIDQNKMQMQQLEMQQMRSNISTANLTRQQLQMKIDSERDLNTQFKNIGQAQPDAVPTDGAGRFASPNITGAPQPPAQSPMQKAYAGLPPEKQAAFQLAWRSGQRDEAVKILRDSGGAVSVGDKAVDKNFAKTYEEDVASGALYDALSNVKVLESIASNLEKPAPGHKAVSGPVIGMMPDKLLAFTNPDAVDIRNNVASVIQRSLRPVLGAQFTEKEGENLIARAYNPQLSEAENAKRLRRLANVTRQMAQQKIAAAQYFEKNGTLKGFKGSAQFSTGDILSAIDAPDEPTTSVPKGTYKWDPNSGDIR